MNTTGKLVRVTKHHPFWSEVIRWDIQHFSMPWKEADWEQLDEQSHLFVWLENDIPLGFALFHFLKGDDTAHLLKIFVLPENQGKGVAQNFWTELLREFPSIKIYLEVEMGNMKAIKFYQKQGFLPLRTIKGYYSNGSDALTMLLTQ
ncbi:MAG: GNAT family N-acetyltransferase [Bacteriovoracaceae bacterium]